MNKASIGIPALTKFQITRTEKCQTWNLKKNKVTKFQGTVINKQFDPKEKLKGKDK